MRVSLTETEGAMAEFTFVCGKCGESLEAPEELAGEIVECPSCNESIVVPPPSGEAPVDEPDAEAADGEPACPSCGAVMEEGAVLCLQCGYHTKLEKHIDTDFS